MSFWSGRTVLVTGAHGFTGSHLCRELAARGAKVKALVKKSSSLDNVEDLRAKIDIVEGDVVDFESTLKIMDGVDYVFHPAAVVPVMDARKNPQRSMQVNGIGSFNVAYAAMKAGAKKMLHVSTCHVYGNLPESDLPIRESCLPRPGDLYAASKYAAEIYLKPLINEGCPVVISRAFAKFGPGQGEQYLIPRIMTQLLRGEKPKLGSPIPTRDYSYITDIVKGYLLLLEKGTPGEIYHLSSEKETSVGEVYDRINRIIGKKIAPEWNHATRPQDILRLYGESARARKDFGWKPEISLEKGLELTIEWWKKKLAVTA